MTQGSPPQHVLVVSFGGTSTIHPLPRAGRVTIGRAAENDVVVDDPSVSRRHAVLHLGPPLRIEDLGGQNGTRLETLVARGGDATEATLDVRDRRVSPCATVEVALGDFLWLGAALLIVQRAGRDGDDQPVVRDPKMRELFALAERVAAAPVHVLLLGETGSGKEVLVEAIHAASPRAQGPLVRVNCAALPESLAESELFGHERGAFTGATHRKQGLVEAADGGTLFLDEVGELSAPLQAKLLRVLEDGRVTPVGAVEPKRVDLRVVAATHRDLALAVSRGELRQDLYFRLDGFTLRIPPLRQRVSEIAPLAERFLRVAAARVGRPAPALAPETVCALERHGWPGNVRELRNVMERALVLCEGATVRPEHVPLAPGPAADSALAGDGGAALPDAVEALERQRIEEALRQCGGNQTRAAELLGISRRTLVYRLGKYDLTRPRRRSDR